MSRYVDIHSHQANLDKTLCIRLMNIMLHTQNIPTGQIVSAGWHPWFIQGFAKDEIELRLECAVKTPGVIAIGECGLDRTIEANFAFQIQVFNLHLKCATENQLPMVIHCVRAFSDLLSCLKKEKFTGKLILHNFMGNLQQVNELQKYNTWFSFGKSIFNNEPKRITVFQSIPVSRLFLETDDSAYQIENIYSRAAEIRSIEPEKLKECLEANFMTVFGAGVV